MTDGWSLVRDGVDLDDLAGDESRFSLSNGHLGLRGNLDEGEPFGTHGTFLSGFHELRPLPYAEAGYGFPESGQTVINVTNGKIMRLLVDDEPFDLRYGCLVDHRRELDMAAGTLRRDLTWESPAGQRVRISVVRLVSFTQRAVAALRYSVRPLTSSARVVIQSELIANEPQHEPRAGDPRVAAALGAPLVSEDCWTQGATAVLVHRAKESGLRVAAGMDHVVECDARVDMTSDCGGDLARVTFAAALDAEQSLHVVKLLGYGWSAVRSKAALRDQAAAAIAAARTTGWDGLVAEQRSYLDEFWSTSDIEIVGDEELQRAVRFSLFTVCQASARSETQAIAAKGLTGTGYDGHAFWDTEAYVVPMLCRTLPDAARHELRWRHSTLPIAESRAQALRLGGAAFPWRTISGHECSGYWPAGTAAFHVNAAIAGAVSDYVDATGDDEFDAGEGLDLLVGTARLWNDLGRVDDVGRFHVDGVTGPDEYSAIVDDNLYTNVVAARNLSEAAAVCRRRPERAAAVDVDDDEIARWESLSANVHLPFDERLGVHSQDDAFTQHERWDFEMCRPDQYPLFGSFPYFDLYRRQVVKQADLVLAIERCSDRFDEEQQRRDFAYYEAITVRDSSLSASSQGVVAARLGHLDLAMAYLHESAFIDLNDSHRNTADGLHIGAAAGVWWILVHGFAGLASTGRELAFAPRCPGSLQAVRIGLRHRGRALRLEIGPGTTTYALTSGDDVRITHHGAEVRLSVGTPVRLDNPPVDASEPPEQPYGRRPPLN